MTSQRVTNDGEQRASKKRTHSVPDERKDDQYWERRKKNNESAKRSRDARRIKEEIHQQKIKYLSYENEQLRAEANQLRDENRMTRQLLLMMP